MTYRPSSTTEHHRLHPADPAQPLCDYRSATRKTTASITICTAVSAYSAAYVTVSAVMRAFSRTHDPAVAPTVCALLP